MNTILFYTPIIEFCEEVILTQEEKRDNHDEFIEKLLKEWDSACI